MDYPNRLRGDDPRIVTRGDFNGDGWPDHVALSENVKTGEFALVARVSAAQGKARIIVIRQYDWHDLARMAVSPAAPGTYETACSRGLGSGPCPVKSVTIENDGFYLFVMEASAVVFYWKDGGFQKVVVSD